MRSTRDFALLAQWSDCSQRWDLVRPEYLAAARCEAVFRAFHPCSSLDVVFEERGRVAVLAGILVDGFALLTRGGPALIWPAQLATTLDPGTAEALEAAISPWLRTLTLGRAMAGEHVRTYRPAPAFERARALGLPGAAPFALSVVRMAPFVYARRFAAGARVRLACAGAALGAAVLRGHALATSIRDDASDDAAFMRAWFGVAAGDEAECPDVEIVDCAGALGEAPVGIVLAGASPVGTRVVIPEPVPHDLLFTFDGADAPEAGSFVVRARPLVPARAPRIVAARAATPRSQGRVAVWLPPEAEFGDDAAVDEAYELAHRLRAEGLTVDVAARLELARAREFDLVHVFGGVDAATAQRTAALRNAHVPYALTLAPLGAETSWAEEVLFLVMQFREDDAHIERDLALMRRRLLALDGHPFAFTGEQQSAAYAAFYDAVAGAVMTFVAFEGDAAALRERYPAISPERFLAAGILVGPEPQEDGAIAERIGARPFALVHAPALKRANPILAAAALADGQVPLVVAGPAGDVTYLSTMRRVGAPDAVYLTDPSPQTIAALYRRAALFIETSHRPSGLARVARAVLCGALPLVPVHSPLAATIGEPALLFDPLDLAQTAGAIRAALERPDAANLGARIAARFAAATDAHASTARVLAGYARAAGAAV